MVRAEGLEPPHLSTTGPKPAASTNSATRADAVGGGAYNRRGQFGNPKHRQRTVLRRVRRGRSTLHATARTPRAADDAIPAAGAAAAARPTGRTAAGHTNPLARHRCAVSAFAGHEPVP